MENIKSHSVYTNYGADEEGNIYSKCSGDWKILKPVLNKMGYYQFAPGKKGSRHKYHRFVYQCIKGEIPKDLEVDHIDRNKLNNKISNLRLVSHSENCRNVGKRHCKRSTSKYKGVSLDRNKKFWCARLTHNKKLVYIEFFTNELDAAKAYDREAKKYGYPHNNIEITQQVQLDNEVDQLTDDPFSDLFL